jgi:uncharacterized iron-regulated protein
MRLALLFLVLLAGCSTPRGHVARAPASLDVRKLPIFDGADGRRISWSSVLAAANDVDFVLIGEQHDDAIGHAVELALVEDMLERWPGSAISMEMLERDEQVLLDDYLDGIITAKAFVSATESANWGGPGGWTHYYQPIVDAGKSADGSVIAANAPRRYVSLARKEGYDRIESLSPTRRDLTELPISDSHEDYRDRFHETMSDAAMGEHRISDEDIDAYFDSQLVWDATMADSVATAQANGAEKVVHIVGRFHVDFHGGLVSELRARAPDARILVISMEPLTDKTMRPEDIGRADIVIYTGP